MNKFWERFFYLLTFVSQGPSFLTPSGYAALHLKHHLNSDTKDDPHSPKHSDSIWKMMLNTFKKYKELKVQLRNGNYSGPTVKVTPLHKLDKFAESYTALFTWIFIYCSIYYLLEIPLKFYPLLVVHFFMGPIQGAIVNWFGHKVGYRNFLLKDESRNSLFIDFALMGELYQNNHHKNGNKMNFAFKWYEVDITYQLAKILNMFRVIRLQDTGR